MDISHKPLTKKDVNDAKKIADLFSCFDPISEAMALTYLSALRDKQLVEAHSSNNESDHPEEAV